MLRYSFLALIVVAGALAAPRELATGCAPAPPPGAIVRIANEAAIIVWDAAAKREHFIRRAAFETSAADFGFLVPTPTRPTLTEVNQEAFKQLAEVTAPKINYVKRPVQAQPGCGCSAQPVPGMVKSAAPNAQPKVEVLEQTRIAGQDAAVLAADDAEVLQTWLKDNGYEVSPKLTEWVQPYLEQKWVITAFKYAKASNAEKAATELDMPGVCMSFDTERPFYPYREPKADPATLVGERLLRVFFLSTEKMDGVLDHAEQRWPGATLYAKPVSQSQRAPIFEMLKLTDLPSEGDWWLTEFEDASSPRPGVADVYFSPAKEQTQVERPPITVYVSTRGFPLDLTFSVLAVGLAALGWQRRRK